MENTLKFLSSQSIADFKSTQNVSEIKILRNEETGKSFFSYGGRTGAVTARYPDTPLTKPIISEVCSEDTGETFYLLHNESEGGATQLEVL